MRYNIAVLFLISFCAISNAQYYTVSSFQKINDINGGFNASLDVGDWFGHPAEEIGDLNGDKVNDVAVSQNGAEKGSA